MIEALLAKYNYTYSGICNCDGVATRKYKNGSYEVRWRFKRYTFKLKKNNETLVNWSPLSVLEIHLQAQVTEAVPVK